MSAEGAVCSAIGFEFLSVAGEHSGHDEKHVSYI